MYNVYFDSGTSNTRVYLLYNNSVMHFLKERLGSRDSSIIGGNTVLLKGLKQLYDRLLECNKLDDKKIQNIYASGMVTSPFGIVEVPHLSTPVSIKQLYDGIYPYFEKRYFKRNIHLIRGVKTIPDNFPVDKYNIASVNNMRGEEIEVFGVLSEKPEEWKTGGMAVFLPGSHTHIAYIKDGMLCDILSTFSGELFHAVSTNTILSGSIDSGKQLDEEMVSLGFRELKQYGLNRALYVAHTMKIFKASDDRGRKSYLEGVLTGGVASAFEEILRNKWRDVDTVLVAGNCYITEVYAIILRGMEKKLNILTLTATEKVSFAVRGLLEVLKQASE